MKVKGLDGREYPWPPKGHTVDFDDRRKRSQFHLNCRALLREMYPTDIILEEVPLPGSNRLSADFYLPWRNAVIEVHGEQHYKFNSFFHGSKMAFFEARQRDLKKIEWCNENNIEVIELPYNETIEQWRIRIERGNTTTEA
jgi:hypothetical protein